MPRDRSGFGIAARGASGSRFGNQSLVDMADVYVRVSIDAEGSTSIERQEADCRRWCATHGVPVRCVHADRGVSGYAETAHRAGFDAALAAVVTGDVSTLVVWKLDRLSRRGIGQVGDLLDRFERCQARLVSVQDQLDTAVPQSRMVMAILSEFARAESETMGARVHSALEARRAAGLTVAGRTPFGYQVAPDHRLAPVEPAASLMREVFRRLLAGETLLDVCERLNRRGERTTAGKLWSVGTLSHDVSNPAYAGLQRAWQSGADSRSKFKRPEVYRHPDTGADVSCLTPGAKPLISRAEQLEIFELLDRRRRTRPRHAPNAEPLLRRGLGHCANCGRPLRASQRSYRCEPRDAAGLVRCARPTNASVCCVDSLLAGTWLQLVCVATPESDRLRREVVLRWVSGVPRPTRWRGLQDELEASHARRAAADEAYSRGELDADRHAHVARALARRVDRLQALLTGTDSGIDTAALDDEAFVQQHWEAETNDGRRELVRMAWSKIVIAKAVKRGRVAFDPARITCIPATTAAGSDDSRQPLNGARPGATEPGSQ